MSDQVFALPDVGEGLTEAEIVRWRVAPGDTVAVNDPIVDIETAKAVVELPSPFAGVVSELLVAEGQIVAVGAPILAVSAGDTQTHPARTPVLIGYGVMEDRAHVEANGGSSPSMRATPTISSPSAPAQPAAGVNTQRVLAKPPVRALARELGVDITRVTPTGPYGDVTRDDVRSALGQGTVPQPTATSADNRRPVRGVQRSMAAAMVASASSAVAVSVWKDIDVSGTVAAVARLREQTGLRITPLTIAALAVVQAVRRTPIVNATWHDTAEGAEIERHAGVQLGIAVAGPRGLVVPKITDADRLDVNGMAAALQHLTTKAREDRITPADSLGGTITITNIGVFDVDGGTPVLPPGQAAILATGRTIDRPWVIDGGLAVRPVMQVSLTFDHRIVDGQQGATFLSDVASFLAAPDVPLA
jgi:pyruvate dehydrogenase E2 component (dihydrolipoamide acetyltransferase)